MIVVVTTTTKFEVLKKFRVDNVAVVGLIGSNVWFELCYLTFEFVL